MKVEFIIYSPNFIERGMSVKADWEFSAPSKGRRRNFSSHYNVSE